MVNSNITSRRVWITILLNWLQLNFQNFFEMLVTLMDQIVFHFSEVGIHHPLNYFIFFFLFDFLKFSLVLYLSCLESCLNSCILFFKVLLNSVHHIHFIEFTIKAVLLFIWLDTSFKHGDLSRVQTGGGVFDWIRFYSDGLIVIARVVFVHAHILNVNVRPYVWNVQLLLTLQ